MITDTVTIDGYTQTDALPATTTDPAELTIEIDASDMSRGLELLTDGSVVSGLVIHGALAKRGDPPLDDGDGISVRGDGNRVVGNHIGTDGASQLPNVDYGVQIEGDGNVVGGIGPGDRNVISSNGAEVRIVTGTGNRIEGNLIGTDDTGSVALGSFGGVIIDSTGNIVGSPDAGNVIAGESDGVRLYGDDNIVQANLIGTNAAGRAALANRTGVIVDGERNTIGGPNPGEGNVVSGNDLDAILLNYEGDFNSVQGNLIGTNAAGTRAVPNGGGFAGLAFSAIAIESNDNTIGGPEPDAGNVVSGNVGDGVQILGDRNTILGNQIGTDATSRWDRGNGGSGVHIVGGALNTIGSTDLTEPGNLISFNGGDGVTVDSGTANTIVRNSMSRNDGLGIDLSDDDVTDNDPAPDGDAGANGLQNFPVLSSATGTGGVTTVTWTLDSRPLGLFRLEFYGTSCDPSGHGEGEIFLGSAIAATDGAGHAEGSTDISSPVGDQLVTATATESTLRNLSHARLYETSEFSACEEVE